MKYIIIAYQIINMGGAQQYYRNKAETLKNKGYDVFIFSSDKGDIAIKDLKHYEYGIFQELKYPLYCFGEKRIEAIIECILHIIGEADPYTIIESSSIAAAQWGELLGERIGCKHFLFNLLEVHSYTQSEIDFLKFKDRKSVV